MCNLRLFKFECCLAIREVRVACKNLNGQYDPNCKDHKIETAGENRPDLWLAMCEKCYFKAFENLEESSNLARALAPEQRRASIVVPESSTDSVNQFNALGIVLDPSSPRLNTTTTERSDRPGSVGESANVSTTTVVNPTVLEPANLYDPHRERHELPKISIDELTPREKSELVSIWPSRNVSFASKKLNMHGLEGKDRTLQQLEITYRALTGAKFANVDYLNHHQKELERGMTLSSPWLNHEKTIVRHICSLDGDWQYKARLYLEKTGKHVFSGELQAAAAYHRLA